MTKKIENPRSIAGDIAKQIKKDPDLLRVNPKQPVGVTCRKHGERVSTLVFDLPENVKAVFCTQCLFEKLWLLGMEPTTFIELDASLPVKSVKGAEDDSQES